MTKAYGRCKSRPPSTTNRRGTDEPQNGETAKEVKRMTNETLKGCRCRATDENSILLYIYYDKNGKQISEGDLVRFDDGRIKTMYITEEGELGEDMTNPRWIENGWANECEYGILPLTTDDCAEAEVI